MKKRLYLILLSAGLLALGVSIGYFYRDRSVNFERYDRFIFELSNTIYMMDALRYKEYDALEAMLAAKVEGETSGMVLLYDRYKFNEFELLRCAVTRKARVLFEKQKILVSREKLEELGYPYNEVKAYFESNCEGKPSHDDWTAMDKPTK